MTKPLLVLVTLAVFPSATLAADTAMPAFPREKIGVPPLSLLEGAKPGQVPRWRDTLAPFGRRIPPPKAEKKVVSNMPVISPSADVTYHLRIVPPDESVDHKMIVQVPKVESAK